MRGELGVVPRRWRRTAWQVAHIVSTSAGGILQGMRVLVVEDEARLALLLKRGLEEEGYAVDVTGDGAEALWLATEADYDAIVLDVMLPSLDGVEVTRRLRAGGRWSAVGGSSGPPCSRSATCGWTRRGGGPGAVRSSWSCPPRSLRCWSCSWPTLGRC